MPRIGIMPPGAAVRGVGCADGSYYWAILIIGDCIMLIIGVWAMLIIEPPYIGICIGIADGTIPNLYES